MTEHDPIALIESRTLPTSVRGYDRNATDRLFEELKRLVAAIVAQRDTAQTRAQEFESRVAALEQRESEITEALVVASRVRAESEQEGKQKADELIRAAEAEAERLVGHARTSARTFEHDARNAQQLAARARKELTTYLESLLAEVERRGTDFDSVVHDLVKRAGDARAEGDASHALADRQAPEEQPEPRPSA